MIHPSTTFQYISSQRKKKAILTALDGPRLPTYLLLILMVMTKMKMKSKQGMTMFLRFHPLVGCDSPENEVNFVRSGREQRSGSAIVEHEYQ
mmetsp:Transcript_25120/g.61941  ORF Transcript_25120/g.61941 Transcript_25120/m.61941 type:complete len:92 (+) Transcript_25120:37-312(+)